MRGAGLVLVVAGLVVAAWLLGRSAARDATPPSRGAGAPTSLAVPAGVRPHELRLVSRRDGMPIAGAVVRDDDKDLGTTDADGRLVVPDDTTFEVHVAGYVPQYAVFTYQRTVWLELEPGIPVAGVVVEAATRAPVAGAFVGRWEPDGETSEDFVNADAAGRFEIMAPVGRPFVLEAVAREGGAADVVDRRIAAAPLRDLEVVMGKGGILEGAVTLADGTPPGRPLVLQLVPVQPPSGQGEAGWTCFDADALGHFRVRGVPLGVDWCVVTFREENARSEPLRFERDGELRRCNLRIPAPASLTVRIEAPEAPAPRGQEEEEPAGDSPLELACVSVESDDFRPGAPKLIGGRQWGPETAFDLRQGPVKVTVTVDGWAVQVRRVVLREGEAREEVFRLEGGETLEGVLLDVGGTPDKETRVSCVGRGFDAECKTDAATGRFLLRGLPKGPATLVAGWGDAAVVWQGAVPASGLVVRTPRAALLTGRIAGVEDPGPLRMEVESEHVGYGETPFLFEGGRFFQEITAVGKPAVVSFSLDSFGAPAVFSLPALRPGEVRDLGEIRLDHGRVVRGTVLGPDGRPVVGVSVAVLEAWSDAEARTDSKGEFSLVRMPRKPLWIRVRAEGFPGHIFRVDDGATVRLGAGGTVAGAAPVTVQPEGDEWLERRYADTRIEALPATMQAGAYRAAWDDGRTAEFVVRDSETTTLR